jgi:hypothetical protein
MAAPPSRRFTRRTSGHVIELVGSYGLSAGDRMSLAQELHHRAVTVRDEYLDVRKIADAWREGSRARDRPNRAGGEWLADSWRRRGQALSARAPAVRRSA